MHFSKSLLCLSLASVAVLGATSAMAQAVSLRSAFEKAKTVDPIYLAGIAEAEGNKKQATASGMSYYPQLKLSSAQQETESGGRRDSISLIQPLVSADKIATMRQSGPLNRKAEVQITQKETDLANRLFASYSELVLARETLQQNKARLTALDQQFNAAKRLFSLSQGTLTDVRDAEVKLLQARAEELRLRGQAQLAESRYASIVGELPAAGGLTVNADRLSRLSKAATNARNLLASPSALIEQNPDVILAQQNSELAAIEASRANSAWMPEINVVSTQTRLDGRSSNFTGLSLSLPLSASSFAGLASAASKADQAAQEALDVERQKRLEIEELKTVVEFGASEVTMQQASVAAAELSVEANEKSYKGGVRSIQDVLGSIDVLYTAKTDLMKSVVALMDGLLKLRIIEGNKAADSLAEVESLLR